MSDFVRCNKTKGLCSKELGHNGRCNKNYELTFWKNNPAILKKEVKELEVAKENLQIDSCNKGVFLF